MTPGILEQQHW